MEFTLARFFALLSACAFLQPLNGTAHATETANRPNVVMIMADDTDQHTLAFYKLTQ